jgi:decaprenylphospho-beta-D-ribofuranose 2-oxidase
VSHAASLGSPVQRPIRRSLSGWGRYPVGETDVFRPERSATLRWLITSPDRSLIARGLGASYGDAAMNSAGGTVLMERFNRFLGFDATTGVLSCEAGVTIEELLRHLLPRGFFPPVSPGTKFVTLGGCLACDVHGKNHHQSGAIARHVLDFRLLTARGEQVRCSREERPDLFWATLGGMGLTGIITELRLQLARVETPYVLVDYDRAADLDGALRLFEDDARYTHSVAWLDCLARGRHLGRSVLMRGNPLGESDRASRRLPEDNWSSPRRVAVPVDLPAGLLNPVTVRAFNALFHRRFFARSRGVAVHYERYFYPLDRLRQWNRLYGKRGFVQYQCLLPYAGGREALVGILEAVARNGRASFLSVLKRFGDGEPGQLLSFPRPGYTLTLDIPRRSADDFRLLDGLDDLVLRCGGRVYLAKDARLSPQAFRAMYPETAAWLEVKRRIDPENRFQSDLAARLGLLS